MRLAWVTDPHLTFLEAPGVEAFVRTVVAAGPDALLLGGDIGEADSVEGYLQALAEALRRPVYFVLGNHDFYGGRIAEVREAVRAQSERSPWLRWLPAAGVVPLTDTTALVGHDGWGDGRLGSGVRSGLVLNDHLLIGDFAEMLGPGNRRARWDSDRFLEAFWGARHLRFVRLQALGDEAAAHVRATLPAALERFPRVLFLTHAPPFREACFHGAGLSDDDGLPHFTCHAVGEALREAMLARPDRRLTVLCGHTHDGGTVDVLPNLRVVVGAARYGHPALQDPIEVP